MKRICSIMLTLCMALSVFMALPAAAEDTWVEVGSTVLFNTTDTKFAASGGYTGDGDPMDHFQQEDADSGLKITKLTTTTGGGTWQKDPRISKRIAFPEELTDGVYRIELNYLTAIKGGNITGTIIGDAGNGLRFQLNAGTAISLSASKTSGADGGWVDASVTKPPHTNNQDETLTIEYDAAAKTFQFYVNTVKADTPLLYPEKAGTTKLTAINLEAQDLAKDSYVVFKSMKVLKKQAATTPVDPPAETKQLLKTMEFTQAAETAGAYTISAVEGFSKEYQTDGVKLTRTADNSNAVEFTYDLGTVLQNGKYEIAFEFTENAATGTNGTLNVSARKSGGGDEAWVWAIAKSTPVGLVARINSEDQTTAGWSTVPANEKPAHSQGTKEVQSVVFDTSDQSLVFYKDGVPVTGKKLYTRFANCDGVGKINFKFQNGAVNDSFTLHSVKIYQYTTASEMTDAEKLAADKAAVTDASVLGSQSKDAITENLTLPASPLPNGTTVTWESSNPAVLSANGTVTRQAADTAVTFTGHFANGAATADMVLNLTVKGTGGSGSGSGGEENSDWVLWNDIVFDSLTGANYTIGTSANYDAKVAGGTLTLETKTTSTDAWGGAVMVNIPADKPISGGKFYIEYAFEVNRTSDTPNNTQFLTRFRKNGTDILTMTAKPTSFGMKASKTQGTAGGWSDIATADYPKYTHATKMTFGMIYDTSDGSIQFCQDRKQIGNKKYYGMGSDPNRIDDVKIDLEGKSQPGECAKLYHFKVWKLDDSAFMADYNALTLESLTDEPAGMITKNLNALPTALENGTTVQWTISDPAVIAQDGTVTAGSSDKQVTLTALLTRGSLSDTKIFRLTVPAAGKADRYLYLSNDTFASEADFASWDLVPGDAEVKNENGRLYMKRQTANQDVSATKYFVTNDADNHFAAVGENVTVEYQVEINQNLREMKAEILDTDDNVVSDLMITDAGKDDDPSAVLTAGYNDGSADVAVTAAYTDNTAINVKYEINTVTGAMKVSVGGKVVATGKVKSGAKNVSAVKFSTGFEGRYGIMQLDNVNLLVESANKAATKAALDKANLTFEQIKGSEKNRADAVVENLNLPDSGWLGSEITWTTDNAAAISDAGVVTRSGEDRQVTLTATVKNGEVTETVAFPLVVKGINANNLALAAKITASSGRGTIENVNDAVLDTAWVAGAVNPYVQVEFGTAQSVSRVILNELEVSGSYLVTGYVIEVSNDGSNWTTVSEGNRVGANQVIDFVPVETNYLRYRVTSQNNGKTGLNELEVYFEPSDANRVKADIQWLKTTMTGYAVNGPLELPLTGKFGSAISWVSSNEDVMSSDGTVYTKPQKDTTFTMTATVKSNQYSENQPFSKMAQGVSGSGTPGTGNGGSGGGGKGSGAALGSGGGLVNVVGENTPAPTPTPTPNNYGTFRDVPKDSWSYEYVEALAEQNIVSGYAGAFNPESSVTREEFVKMLLGVLDIEPTETSAEFSDVPAGEWYVPYVATAAKLGIVDGVGDGKFGVGRTIVRQDMALMVQRALEAADKTLQQEGALKTFQDAASISGYAKDAVDMLVRANIISGDENGRFNPQESLTREQAAKIICLSGGILNEE